MKGTPFFQAASTTFRNYFFDKNLLDTIIEEIGDCRCHPCCGDAFNLMLAFHMGNVFFENSPDSCWRVDVGEWGTLSQIEQNFMNMKGYYYFFEFYRKYWGIDENAVHCLNLCWNFYNQVWDNLIVLGKSTTAHKFSFTSSAIMEDINTDAPDSHLNTIFEYLKTYSKFFSDLQEGKL